MSIKNIESVSNQKQLALKEVSDKFGVADTVRALQKMMTDVTAKDITPESVNAACNCVQGINNTVKTAIQAAKFLANIKDGDE